MENSVLVERLREQIMRACYYPFYVNKYKSAGIDPLEIHSLEDFQKLPFFTRKDQHESFKENPPFGALYHPKTVWITHTPTEEGLLPEYHTREDWAYSCRVFAHHWRSAGVTENDIVQNANQFNLVVGANLTQYTAIELGAKVINIGAGDTQRQLEIMRDRGTTVLQSQPSFIMKLGMEGADQYGIRIILAGGEPFTAIEGYKEKMRSVYGQDVIICDLYGISGFNIVAQECRYERGMHIFDEYVYLEIIDPETGHVLPDGERGEIVMTHLHKTAMPLIRFRTGDLSVRDNVVCPCGKRLSLPKGVFGRTTEMLRVKGLKFYPSQVAFVLAGTPGVSPRDYRIIVSRPEYKTDRVELELKGNPSEVDIEQLQDRLKQKILFTMSRITIKQDLESGIHVEDQRGGLDR